MKYTPEMLAEAAANSTTIAGVLRHLGIRLTGGAHTHIKRRLVELGIDHTHFTGRGDHRGRRSVNRLTPDQVLIIRERHRRRPHGSMLAKALVEVGVPLRCQGCGIGPMWNGTPLTMHVDHIDGDYSDCRRANLRFLCPNCHSQTKTFAGRGKRQEGPAASNRPKRQAPPLTTLNVDQAAQLLGCSRSHFYKLRAQIANGTFTTELQSEWARQRDERRLAVIECALRHPHEGPRKIAERLRLETSGQISISHGTVANVLGAAGLNTADSRKSAAHSD